MAGARSHVRNRPRKPKKSGSRQVRGKHSKV
jgi:hypothetical protein